MKRFFSFLLLFPLGQSVAAPAEWHQNLYLPGESYWQKRVPVDALNATDSELAGYPLVLPIGAGPGQVALVGTEVRQVRVCDEAGGEFLFQILDRNGARLSEGEVPAGSRILIPAECGPRAKVRYYIYFDNPTAWAVPDFFEGVPGVSNSGMESGKSKPLDWKFDRPDSQHRMIWTAEAPRSGKKCLKCVVSEGAEPTWIAARQSGLSIIGGAKYRFEGWVRAKKAKGRVGWYLHIGNQEKNMISAPMIDSGPGSYPWKKVSLEFTAPEEANLLSFGTVLRGTGTAWYDDASLTALDPPKVQAKVGQTERLVRHIFGKDTPWLPAEDAAAFPFRAPIVVRNLSDRPVDKGLVQAPLRVMRIKLGKAFKKASFRLVDPVGKAVPFFVMEDDVFFESSSPPRTERIYQLYVSPRNSAQTFSDAQYASLVKSKVNLARNSLFEDGEDTPSEWEYGLEGNPNRKGLFSKATGGKLSSHCASFTIPADHPKGWVGWRQKVRVRPNRRYWYSAWVRTREITNGTVALHGHQLQRNGKYCKVGKFFSTGDKLEGTHDWTFLHTTVRSQPDSAFIELHLTMNARGTLSHDGVLLCELLSSQMGHIESAPVPQATPLSIWAVNPLVKVFRDSPPQSSPRSVAMFAARNESECLQLVLRSSRKLGQVEFRIVPPKDAAGNRLKDIVVQRVGFVPIDHPTSYYQSELPLYRRRYPTRRGTSDGWSDDWPDPLLPGGPFALEANSAQPVWITVRVPKDARPGTYSGEVIVAAPGMEAQTIPLDVTVWDFTLPDEPSLTAIFDLRSGPSGPFLNDQNRREWLKFMAEHRASPGIVGNLVKFAYRDGKASIDFSEFDPIVSYCLDTLRMRTLYTPWQFYGFGWAHPGRRFLGKTPFTREHREVYQACLKAFWAHLREKGWDDNFVLYVSDEPHFREEGVIDRMKQFCELIHEAVPEARIYSSTWQHVPEWNGQLDIWGIGAHGNFPVPEMAARKKAGEQLWFTTDGKMCTDTPYCAIERLYPYYCWKYGADAYEFWGLSWWTYDPYKFGWHSYIHQSAKPGEFHWVRYPNGDGFLAYPGPPEAAPGPVSTIRLEQVREGMEDYEYFKILVKRMAAAKAKGRSTGAASALRSRIKGTVTIPNAGGLRSTSLLEDPDEILELRRQIGRAIEKLK